MVSAGASVPGAAGPGPGASAAAARRRGLSPGLGIIRLGIIRLSLPAGSDVSATPPTSSAAASQRGPLMPSPSTSAAEDIPKTGTSSENGATAEAS
ncbi:hypothetical protein GCM10009579_60820 [Streptomyces javensis]|uniref:Uncharacterized protein n=1 Tax=Streptomyces javensis TaxID=114698 RepID=A0ABN1X935_9ACTN